MKPFKKPVLENYKFTSYTDDFLTLPDIEIEIQNCIEKIIRSHKVIENSELSIIYYSSVPATTQYVITIGDKLDYQDDFWLDISLRLFSLLTHNMSFELLYENKNGKVYIMSEYVGGEALVEILKKLTRESYIEEILKTV